MDLLKRIITGPCDLAARLEYADRIADQDRADFIRHQVWLARNPEAFDDPKWLRYTRSVDRAEEGHGEKWSPAALARAGVEDMDFHAGFVDHVTIDAERLFRNVRDVFVCAPIRHLTLLGAKGRCHELCALPEMRRVFSLDLACNDLGDGDVAPIARAELPELRWLSLAGNAISFEGARSLAGAKGLPGLRFVDFVGNPCDPGDTVSYDEGAEVDASRTAEGIRLEQEFGPLPWLRRFPVSIRNRFRA